MTQYRLKNWEKYQHYKKRNPPWIKLHAELLSSDDWVLANDRDRVLMIACMIIASKNDGVIDGSERGKKYLKRVAYLNVDPDFESLLACGFLIEQPCKHDASMMLADTFCTNQVARPETETETETETEKETEAEKETETDQSRDIVCSDLENPKSEPSAPQKEPDVPIVTPEELTGLTLYQNNAKLCKAWPDMRRSFEQAYGNIDVLAELRKAHAWEVANPKKRKVDKLRFLGNWMARAQDYGGNGQNKQSNYKTKETLRSEATKRAMEEWLQWHKNEDEKILHE